MSYPRLYERLIAPILYYPGQSYEPKKKYVENPVVWYPEEMEHELKVKYQYLNTNWDILDFEEKYEVYT